MKVSIVSVFYNRQDLVSESVTSLMAQTYEDLEIVLVDDGSEDRTLDELNKFSGHENVKILELDNLGFVGAIRKAIDKCGGGLIAIHGSGDVSHPSRVERQAKVMIENSKISVVGALSIFRYFGTGDEYVNGRVVSGCMREQLKSGNLFHHGEVMFRRDIYEKVGGYREYFKYAQDYDLWCRMSFFGEFHVVNEVLYTRFVNVPGSVCADPRKAKLQAALSDFARYCHMERCCGREDPLNVLGPHAALFYNPSRLSSVYIRRGLRSIFSNDQLGAAHFFQWASEQGGIKAQLLLIMTNRCFGTLRKIVAVVLSISRRRRKS